MFCKFDGISIEGIASAVPNRRINNLDLFSEDEITGSLKKQLRITGIQSRYLCKKGQDVSDLATTAAKRLLSHLSWDLEHIDVIVFVAKAPCVQTPATAAIIQARLGIGKGCLCFDTNLGCTGFTSGLEIISGIIRATKGRGLLLLGDGEGKETISKEKNDLLFGHGASAVAVQYKEDSQGLLCTHYTDGMRHNVLTRALDGTLHMDGLAVMSFSINEVADAVVRMKEHYGIREEEIDYYVFHQAQKLIVEGVSDACSVTQDRLLISYPQYGNTTAATIPMAICHHAGTFQKEQLRLMMVGFGVGLSYSMVYAKVEAKNILPVEMTDECYGMGEDFPFL